MLALSLAARIEMKAYNVGVTVVCPGIVDTSLVSHGRLTVPEGAKVQRDDIARWLRTYGWPPDKVAKAILRAVRRNSAVAPLGAAVRLLWLMNRIAPRATNAVGQKFYDRLV